jgi:mannose-1-phosphate guanylyltransferase
MRLKSRVSNLLSYRIQKGNRYAVILAGGDGTRLQSLTRVIVGDERPKQFCPILGDESLLDKTRKRVALSVSHQNTHFSLTQKHERFYSQSLLDVSTSRLAVQPENRGTAPAILYSLLKLAKSNPDATVAFFPSDHYFSNDAAFMKHVDAAFSAVAGNPESVVLLGIEPEKAETSYGWIEPVESFFGEMLKSVSRVNRFWEKPTAGVAEHLLMQGCLWNSFVMVGRVETFISMFKKHLPQMFRMFAAAMPLIGTTQEMAVMRSIYSWLDDTNFSSEVLEKSADQLLVMRVGKVGWSDWGEPERVINTLQSIGLQPQWLQALAA